MLVYCRYGDVRARRACPARTQSGVLRTQDAHHLRGAQTQTGRSRQEREGGAVDRQTSVHRQHVRLRCALLGLTILHVFTVSSREIYKVERQNLNKIRSLTIVGRQKECF